MRVLVPVEELLFFNPPSLMLKLNLKVLMMVVKVAKRNSVGLKKNFKFHKKEHWSPMLSVYVVRLEQVIAQL